MDIKRFLKEGYNSEKYIDNIFSVTNLAKNDNSQLCINATIGSLYDEEGRIVTYKSVYDSFNKIPNTIKASYPKASNGNPNFRSVISDFVLENRITNPYSIVTTSGGTGAIYLAINACLKENDTILFPSIAWGNYKTIASERSLNVITYDLYDIDDLINKINKVTGKLCLVINSPCENPCGHKYEINEWKTIINTLNNRNNINILINDIAYIDYSNNDDKEYFKLFNELNENTLTFIAYSLSKTFSFYGVRLGALFTIHQDKNLIDHIDNLLTRAIRTTWSQANNGAMECVVDVLTNHKEEFIKELESSKKMLSNRTELFIKEANECNLEHYDYNSGFFITLKVENSIKEKIHQKLIENHIYTIKVNNGIRIGICSVSLKQVKGLALKIKKIIG